jgi:hypothetical protein
MKQMKMKKRRKTYAAQKQNYSAGQARNYPDDENIGRKWYSVVSCMFVLHVCSLMQCTHKRKFGVFNLTQKLLIFICDFVFTFLFN